MSIQTPTEVSDARGLIEASLRYFGMGTTYSEQATNHVLSDLSAAGYVIVPPDPTCEVCAQPIRLLGWPRCAQWDCPHTAAEKD